MSIAHVLATAARFMEGGGYEHIIGHPMTRAIYDAAGKDAQRHLTAYDFMADFLNVNWLSEWNHGVRRTGPEVATWLSSAAEYAKVLGR